MAKACLDSFHSHRSCCKKNPEMDCQPFPTKGHLAENMNLKFADFKKKMCREKEDVYCYCYVIASVENRNGKFVQTGSGPNFQGGMITLCTCKHFMRTFMEADNWKGKWIAGFSGLPTGENKNVLLYLMKVENAFDSQMSLWFSRKISKRLSKLNQPKQVNLVIFTNRKIIRIHFQ